ncbi:TRM11 family SAM-dependent methyltransferase [Kytococcus aerolatus]|nr:DNA methyltransferase [Kytococcus aerolatus]
MSASGMLDSPLTTTLQAFRAASPPGADEDVHMVPAIVDHVIERLSRPGDTVFDPFAGFGTTLERAVRLGRRAAGVELLPERVEYMRARTPGAWVAECDARDLRPVAQGLAGGVDLVVSSPPYMTMTHHEADPLTAYEESGGDYARYLRELGLVAEQCARLLTPGGHLVWNVADILHEGVRTLLIDDCARVLDAHLTREAVVPIEWDELPHDLAADALLIFRRAPAPAGNAVRSERPSRVEERPRDLRQTLKRNSTTLWTLLR